MDDDSVSNTIANATKLAASEKPSFFGKRTVQAIMLEAALRIIKAFRSKNGLWDLFGQRVGTIAHASFDGADIFGSNSTSPMYSSVDRAEADRLRAALIEKYPDDFAGATDGQMPSNALYHAETNLLTRIARKQGGTLAGRDLEVVVDGAMCNNCRYVLPRVGLELGNPTVTFIDRAGRVATMRDGVWLDRK